MDKDAPSTDVHDPVFADSRTGIEAGSGIQIEAQRRIGSFDEQEQILGAGMPVYVVGIGLGADGDIRFGFIILRADWRRGL
jgi:hypothetical protein